MFLFRLIPMNWTTRINRIASRVFPFTGGCLHERQMILRLRIERSDKLKRLIAGKSPEEQNEILTEIEQRYAEKTD